MNKLKFLLLLIPCGLSFPLFLNHNQQTNNVLKLKEDKQVDLILDEQSTQKIQDKLNNGDLFSIEFKTDEVVDWSDVSWSFLNMKNQEIDVSEKPFFEIKINAENHNLFDFKCLFVAKENEYSQIQIKPKKTGYVFKFKENKDTLLLNLKNNDVFDQSIDWKFKLFISIAIITLSAIPLFLVGKYFYKKNKNANKK